MEIAGISEKDRGVGWTDEEIVERVKSGDTALYEVVMRRYNQRLYRIARAILHDDGEAEDVMQAAYVRAPTSTFTNLRDAHPFPLGSRALPFTKPWPACNCATATSNSKTPGMRKISP